MTIATSGCVCCCTVPGLGATDNTLTPTYSVLPGPVAKVSPTPLVVTSTPKISPLPAIAATPLNKPAPLTEITRLPTGTYIARSYSSGEGELTIENGLDEDAVVLMTTEVNPKKTVIGVYVRAGDSFTVTGIPDGYYIIYDRTGLDWDINTNQFTRPESGARFEDILNYETTSDFITTYELTLQKVEGGNAMTYNVSDSELPSV